MISCTDSKVRITFYSIINFTTGELSLTAVFIEMTSHLVERSKLKHLKVCGHQQKESHLKVTENCNLRWVKVSLVFRDMSAPLIGVSTFLWRKQSFH